MANLDVFTNTDTEQDCMSNELAADTSNCAAESALDPEYAEKAEHGNEGKSVTDETKAVEAIVAIDEIEEPQAPKTTDESTTREKARFAGKRPIYAVLAAVLLIIGILVFAGSSGSLRDSSARLDQITINYPSDWTMTEDGSILVDRNDATAGTILWRTSPEYHGINGVNALISYFANSVSFNGQMNKMDIDGVTAYRQAISGDGLDGEALFVPTDEGITFVLALTAPENQEVLATMRRVLDSAVLTPGNECIIKIESKGSTLYTVAVYDYGKGAGCHLNVDDGGNGNQIPTSGEVITGWNTSDPSVTATKDDEGAWEVSGVTTDVTLEAVWTSAHEVIFTDGNGNTIATVGVLDGEAAIAPDAPSQKGYVFDGWDTDYSRITADTTVNAKWIKAHADTSTDSMSYSPLLGGLEAVVPEGWMKLSSGERLDWSLVSSGNWDEARCGCILQEGAWDISGIACYKDLLHLNVYKMLKLEEAVDGTVSYELIDLNGLTGIKVSYQDEDNSTGTLQCGEMMVATADGIVRIFYQYAASKSDSYEPAIDQFMNSVRPENGVVERFNDAVTAAGGADDSELWKETLDRKVYGNSFVANPPSSDKEEGQEDSQTQNESHRNVSDLYTYSEFVEQADTHKGKVFRIEGRVTGVDEGTSLIKVTEDHPQGGKLDTVIAYVQWGDDTVFRVGQVALVEIEGWRYYGDGWTFRGDRIKKGKTFTASCTFKGLNEDGHPVFTCTKWTCG